MSNARDHLVPLVAEGPGNSASLAGPGAGRAGELARARYRSLRRLAGGAQDRAAVTGQPLQETA